MTAASTQGNEKNSSAKEERKLRKPLIEKKRRERINCSLEQLKGIMVDAYNLDQSKLEKADVLEITVQHMEGLQKGSRTGSPAGPNAGSSFEARQRYSTGYIQCMHEVHNLLLSCPGLDKSQGARLLNHLLGSLPHVDEGEPGGPGRGPEAPETWWLATPFYPRAHFPVRVPLPAPPLAPGQSPLQTPSPSPPPAPSLVPLSPPGVGNGRRGGCDALSVPPLLFSPRLPHPPPSRGAGSSRWPPPVPPWGDPSMWRPW